MNSIQLFKNTNSFSKKIDAVLREWSNAERAERKGRKYKAHAERKAARQ
jgi:hypothetical protein